MIAISAGHFGIGTGAVGFIDEVEESVKVVEQVTTNLQQQLAVTKIIDTQSKNQRQNLTYLRQQHERVNRKLDVFIHFNATSKTEARAIGTEVLYKDTSMQPLAKQLCVAISNASGLKNRGAKQRQDLFMLNTSKVGAVLIEVCFVNSKVDVQLYKQHFHQICRAISDVLCQYVGDTPQALAVEAIFSSQTLQRSFQKIMNDKAFQKKIIEQSILAKVVQSSWLQRLEEGTITQLDFCTIALLLLKK